MIYLVIPAFFYILLDNLFILFSYSLDEIALCELNLIFSLVHIEYARYLTKKILHSHTFKLLHSDTLSNYKYNVREQYI